MVERKECATEGCSNLQSIVGKTKAGEHKYRKLCKGCHNRKYGMKRGSANTRRKTSLLRKHGKACMRCGWDKAPTDYHRIKPGKEGGTYRLDNVMSLCPNCHRELTFGVITEQDVLDAYTARQSTAQS